MSVNPYLPIQYADKEPPIHICQQVSSHESGHQKVLFLPGKSRTAFLIAEGKQVLLIFNSIICSTDVYTMHTIGAHMVSCQLYSQQFAAFFWSAEHQKWEPISEKNSNSSVI